MKHWLCKTWNIKKNLKSRKRNQREYLVKANNCEIVLMRVGWDFHIYRNLQSIEENNEGTTTMMTDGIVESSKVYKSVSMIFVLINSAGNFVCICRRNSDISIYLLSLSHFQCIKEYLPDYSQKTTESSYIHTR